MEENRKVRLLEQTENSKTRKLYEEVFSEDSAQFVDYYYQNKANKNQIYVIEEKGEVCAMLHLNPYQVRLAEQVSVCPYLVAVATRGESRHQGMMRRLLQVSMENMRITKTPFAFLMPAAEAIYYPFDFRFIYEQTRREIFTETYRGKASLICRKAKEKDLDRLSDFAEAYWEEETGAFALHTREYFQTLLEEQDCQNGQAALILEKGEIRGYFFVTCEGETEVREPVIAKGYEEYLLPSIAEYLKDVKKIKLLGCSDKVLADQEKVPLIMARIMNLETFVMGLRAKERVCMIFQVRDEFLPENTGCYELTVDRNQSVIRRISGVSETFTIGIGELTALAFGSLTAKEAGLPEREREKWEKIQTYAPVCFNEVV